MQTSFRHLVSATLIALLAACGGGGDDGGSGNPALTAFMGSWQQACTLGETGSLTARLSLTQLSGNTLSGQATVNIFVGNTGCTGTPQSGTAPISFQYDGIKIVNGVSALKVSIRLPDGSTEKTLAYIRDNKLYYGVDNDIGADGYPNAVDFTEGLTRL